MSKELNNKSTKVEVKNISLKYGSKESGINYILKDLNLDLYAGDFTCLLGPSGCGKSTLLGLLAGFIQCTEGEILVSGNKITRPSIDRTLVFQEYALFPWLNVIDNVSFGLEQKIKDKQERYLIATRYLKMVGLTENYQDKISELSGGMKQRVAIARALAVKPDLLLMDEPFGALDDQTRTDMQTMIFNIFSELKTTVVFVTHSIDEAMLLADRIIVMNQSKKKGESHGVIAKDLRIIQARPRDLNELSLVRNQISEAIFDNVSSGSEAFAYSI